MRHVNFDPEVLPADLKTEWDALQVRASDATDAIVDKWEANRHLESEMCLPAESALVGFVQEPSGSVGKGPAQGAHLARIFHHMAAD